jgi:Domain of unknown function (DUF1877)
MICSVLGVTSAQINGLRAKPALVSKLALVARIDLLRAHLDELTQRMTPEQRAQFEASQAQFTASPAAKKAEAEAEARVAAARAALGPLGPIERALSLEKSWHMLHYLFTGHVGTGHAPGDLLLSGQELGDDVGYGPARLHDQSRTSDFSRFLDGQDLARLRAHTDFDAMNRAGVLYGSGEPADEVLHKMLHEEIAIYFQLLRDYVRAMADKGNGLVVWIS